MTRPSVMKRLERLERQADLKAANQVKVFYADGSIGKMNVLSLACVVAMHPEAAPLRYEPVGEIRAGKLLQVIDDLMEK